MEPLRMGVIGAGFMGAIHAKVWSQLPNTELIAIADLDETIGRSLAGTLGADYHKHMTDLLARNDIDAVSIVTPDRHHVDPATAAARA